MHNSKGIKLSRFARRFLEPKNSTHRQYEALRAVFVDGEGAADAAKRFGYTSGSLQVLCSQFRKNPDRHFFLPPRMGPQSAPKRDRVREKVIGLRKRNLSVYDISEVLKEQGRTLSPVSVEAILKEEGFARLPRRPDEERAYATQPARAAIADVRALDLCPRKFRTDFGGLFLFVPLLAQIPLGEVLDKAGFPGSVKIPHEHAMRSLLALKLYAKGRKSHVMSAVLDDGLALFAGLNAIPKQRFLTNFSCRVRASSYPKLMRGWFDALKDTGIERSDSFHLDFHTIPFHGEDALTEKHYISMRSRRQKGVLAFLAQDAQTRVFCYANAEIRKIDQNDEILRFVDYWKERTGKLPDELIFDSKLTTYAILNKLNLMEIPFITLRRRSPKMLKEIEEAPSTAWRRITLTNVHRIYRNPRVLDEKVRIRHYTKEIRQLTIKDLGHEEPTILITNQLKLSRTKLVDRYARRMLIENNIQDGVDFFHMNALSSAVAMRVNLDLQLTLMASSLYRLLAQKVENGYENAKSWTIFRDLVEASANVKITDDEIQVEFQRRSHNPLLLSAGMDKAETRVPWLDNKKLKLKFV